MPLAMVDNNILIAIPATTPPGTELARLVFEVEEAGEYDLHYYSALLQTGTGLLHLHFVVDGQYTDPHQRTDPGPGRTQLFEQSVWLGVGTHTVLVTAWITGTAGQLNTTFDARAGAKFWITKAPRTIAQVNGNLQITLAVGSSSSFTEAMRLVFEVEETGEYELQYFNSIVGNGGAGGVTWMALELDGVLIIPWFDSFGVVYEPVRLVAPAYLTPGTHTLRAIGWQSFSASTVHAGNEVYDGQWLRVRKHPYDTLARTFLSSPNVSLPTTPPTEIIRLSFEVTEAGEYDLHYHTPNCDLSSANASYTSLEMDGAVLDPMYYHENDQQQVTIVMPVWLGVGAHVARALGNGAVTSVIRDSRHLWIRRSM